MALCGINISDAAMIAAWIKGSNFCKVSPMDAMTPVSVKYMTTINWGHPGQRGSQLSVSMAKY